MGSTNTTKWEIQRGQSGKYKNKKMGSSKTTKKYYDNKKGSTKTTKREVPRQKIGKYKDDKMGSTKSTK
jgi:hypothetical protein